MQLSTLTFLYGVQLVAATTSASIKSCTADNCLRAVIASNYPTRPVSADCGSYLRKTVYPSTVTVVVPLTSVATITATSSIFGTETDVATVTSVQTGIVTISTTTTVLVDGEAGSQKRSLHIIDLPGYGLITKGFALEVRQVTVVPSAIPAYATPCSGAVRYSSACSCIGISQSTITLATPTTVTSTTTYTSTSTTTSTTSSTTTSTTTATTTSTTSSTTAISTTAVPTYTGIPDVPGYDHSGCWDDLLYDYPSLAQQEYTVGSIEECASDCQGYTYFGLYDGYWCVCGDYFDLVQEVDESNCNLPCTGNTNEFCGGTYVDANGYPAWQFYTSTGPVTAPVLS